MKKKLYTVVELAKIVDRSQATVKRWVEEELITEYIDVRGSFLFFGSTRIKCFQKVVNDKRAAMTVAEIEGGHHD